MIFFHMYERNSDVARQGPSIDPPEDEFETVSDNSVSDDSDRNEFDNDLPDSPDVEPEDAQPVRTGNHHADVPVDFNNTWIVRTNYPLDPPLGSGPESVVDTYDIDPLFRALRDEMVFLRSIEKPILTRREGFTFLQETLEFIWGAICSGDTEDEAVAILNNALVKLAAYALLVALEPEN